MGNSCCAEQREGKEKKSDILQLENDGNSRNNNLKLMNESKTETEMTQEDLEKSIQKKKDIISKLRMQLSNDVEKEKNEIVDNLKQLDSIENVAQFDTKFEEIDTDNDTSRSPDRSPMSRKEKKPSVFDKFPIASAQEMDEFRIFAEH